MEVGPLLNEKNTMKNFHSQLKGLANHIIKITSEIWEERNVDKIRRYYHKNVIMHTPYGSEKGVESVVQSTLKTLQIFPDRRLLPQGVVVAGYKEDYHSSHRLISVMHHQGDGIYGAATNLPIQVYTIADCAVRNNRIYEEWLVRDYLAIILQLGLDPLTFVKQQIVPGMTTSGYKAGKMKPIDWQDLGAEADAYCTSLIGLWEEKKLALIPQLYHPACTLFRPGGKVDYGHAAVDAFFISYAAAFSNLRLIIDRVTVNRVHKFPVQVAVRWTLRGLHTGEGPFGPPSGADIHILGISHCHFHRGKIITEWTLIDVIALRAQIELQRNNNNKTSEE